MSWFLQIGIGFFPGVFFIWFFLLKRKAFSIKRLLTALLLSAVCFCFLAVGILQQRQERGTYSEVSAKQVMTLANAVYVQGDYETVRELLEEYGERYGYDENCRLLQARVWLAEENYEAADGLYSYLAENSSLIDEDAEEVLFAKNRAEHSQADIVLLQYLQDAGEDVTEYGYATGDLKELQKIFNLDQKGLVQDICDEIEEEFDLEKDSADICAKVLTKWQADTEDAENTATAEKALTETEEKNTKGAGKALATLEEENPEWMSLEIVRKARAEIYVEEGKYAKITKELSEDSTYHEQMLAAELYMNGLVKKSDFPEEYRGVSAEGAREVKNQLKVVLKKNSKGLSKQEKAALKERVEAVEIQTEAPELLKLKEEMAAQVQNTEETAASGTEASKLYLELAKVENYFGNEAAMYANLNQAIYQSQNSGDDSYAYAMGQIISVIEEEDNTEEIKNVSAYVDAVMEHAMTVDVGNSLNTAALEQEQEQSAEGTVNFAQGMTDYVSRTKNAITIGSVNTENFETITAKVQITSDKNADAVSIKKALKLSDCGIEIKDFSLDKIDYIGSNILLCCDVSGSMEDSIGGLKNAVTSFVKNREDAESVSLVAFNDAISGKMGFGTSDDGLLSFAEGMEAGGGTDIYSAVLSCLDTFPQNPDSNNVLIVMTDGQDNYYHDAADINKNIGELAAERNVTIYTVGLGSAVDTQYLGTIAQSGGGSFVYVSASGSLQSFYDMLHTQLYHQYRLTYKAQDTMKVSDRTLELALPEENVRGSITYSLAGAEENSSGSMQVTTGVSVTGIAPRYLYKGFQDVKVELKGSGFKQDSEISVKLKGKLSYDITAEYVSADTYSLTIPAKMAVGTYHVDVTVDGKRTVLENGFSMLKKDGSSTLTFGKYVFTYSGRSVIGDSMYILGGPVQLNGWLTFKGDVVLTGDIDNGSSLMVTDNYGSYVSYDVSYAEGLGKYMAEKGIALDIPELYQFNIYRDDTIVEDIQPGAFEIYQFMWFDSPALKLHPDNIEMALKTGTTILPFQNDILEQKGAKDLFSFKMDTGMTITNKNVGLILDMEYSDVNKKHTLNVFNTPLESSGSAKLQVNTLTNEYLVGAMIKLDIIQETGIGLEVGWKNNLVPDSVQVQIELPKGVQLPTAVPITMNNFTGQVSGIGDSVQKKDWTNISLKVMVTLESGKVSEFFPALKKFVGDITVLKMPDTAATLRFGPNWGVELEAKLVFLNEITLAQAAAKLGHFSYSNALLDLDEEQVAGLYAMVKQGIIWETADGRVKLNSTGTIELDAHSRFAGLLINGTTSMDIKWWLLKYNSSQTGDLCLGLYTTYSGEHELVLVFKYMDTKKGKIKGGFYYIDQNGKAGKNSGFLK